MEKNRIRSVKTGKSMRMSYQRQKEVLEMPNLIEVQKDSYQWFLDEGLKEVFDDISPIADYGGKLSLEFIDFTYDEKDAKYSIEQCKERDVTYAAPLKVRVRLINKETEEINEHEIFMGDLPLMTATGSSICGAAAVLGAESVVRCEPHKTAVAVSTVVIFGTISMFLYPIIYRTGCLPMDDFSWAVYTGSTLHEVAHVAGAGDAMNAAGGDVASTATITKMIRVIMLAPVLVVMSFMLSRLRRNENGGGKRKITIPWFAFGFLLVICINTFLAEHMPADIYAPLFGKGGVVEQADTFMLAMAMTALGADTTVDKFRQAGAKPFYLAGLLYIWLLVGGYFLTSLLVPMLR